MFTGIIEEIGLVTALQNDKNNLHITIKSNLAKDLKVDQSISHNGVCLTVVSLKSSNNYMVTAIKETLDKSNLKHLVVGAAINLERAMKLGERLDGHIVQGHVDQTAICTDVNNADGSFIFTFDYDAAKNNITIEKGSVTINGVSLTVVNSKKNSFSVAIIPYTLEHTNFKSIKKGSVVNLEFDVIGKYVAKLLRQ
ncbi:MAG: riboflavin synthase [Flavobacteriaceae bacterium]|nr:riboflavin synthase [Flavobacteriaceae bacterium]